jgi:cell division protein FtsL
MRRVRRVTRLLGHRSAPAEDGGAWRRRSVWIGLGVALAMLVAVWERSAVVSLGYEVTQLRKSRDLEQQRHRALILESASLASLDRIERLATTQLGMTAAKRGQIQLVPEQPDVNPAAMVAALHLHLQVAKVEESP